jgi:23S rRNA (uracil1939-C5)-methyltransferase
MIQSNVEKIVSGGFGLCRTPAGAVLLAKAAVGDSVRFSASKKSSIVYDFDLLAPSPDRQTPPCPRFADCGGCDSMHLQPPARIAALRAIVAECLGGDDDGAIEWHFVEGPRTRARWHAKAVGKSVVVGYHAAGSHRIVSADDCLALDPRFAGLHAWVMRIFAGARGQGEFAIGLGKNARPVLAISWQGVLAGATWAGADHGVRDGVVDGVSIRLEGTSEAAVIGDPTVWMLHPSGNKIKLPAGSFAQASEAGNAHLVRHVTALVPEEQPLLELYCGSGNFTLLAAPRASKTTAVESDQDAIDCARANLAHVPKKVRFIVGDASTFGIPPGSHTVLLDPPRTGAREACANIGKSKAKRVVYVSCDPTTFARDSKVLEDARFVRTRLDAFDLFAHTSHVELVGVFER